MQPEKGKGKDGVNEFRYSQAQAQSRLTPIAQLLLPLIEKGLDTGADWKEVKHSILSSSSTDEGIRQALNQLILLSRVPDEWLTNQAVLDYAGLSYNEASRLSELATIYLHYCTALE